jgi:membrane fusion protein (multidrug efflux system)
MQVVALVFFAVVAALLIFWYLSEREYISTDDAYIDADRLSISTQVQERIRCLYFEEGDSVNTGDTMVTLNDSLLHSQLEVASAALESAKKDSARAAVVHTGALQDFARGRYQYQHGTIPRQTFDHLQQALQKAELEYQVSISEVKRAESHKKAALTSLGYTSIVTHSSGRVARRWVARGDVVTPGQSLYTIYKTGEPWVTVNFEETKISSVKVGDTTIIHVDAFGNRTFKGNVLWIGAATASEFSLIPPSNASGNFTKVTQRVPCRISIQEVLKNSSQRYARLVPGMSVEVKVKVYR